MKVLDKVKYENGAFGVIIGEHEDAKYFHVSDSSNGFVLKWRKDSIIQSYSLNAISKRISYLLRHDPEGLKMDKKGYVYIQDLLDKLNSGLTMSQPTTIVDLRVLVKLNSKKRFNIDSDTGTKIRASQGHTIEGLELDLTEVTDGTTIIYHGTSKENYDLIKKSGGILPMSRQYVHMSADIPTATSVGLRKAQNKGDLIILATRVSDINTTGHKVYLSENGVFQVEFVDDKILKII